MYLIVEISTQHLSKFRVEISTSKCIEMTRIKSGTMNISKLCTKMEISPRHLKSNRHSVYFRPKIRRLAFADMKMKKKFSSNFAKRFRKSFHFLIFGQKVSTLLVVKASKIFPLCFSLFLESF